jgi:hypothetical protein
VNTVNVVRRYILDSVSVERFPKLDVAGSCPDPDLVKQLIRPEKGWFRGSAFKAACLLLEQ